MNPYQKHARNTAVIYAICEGEPASCSEFGGAQVCAGIWNICTRRLPINGSNPVPSRAILMARLLG